MSRPRHVFPQRTYLVTQRCSQRQFLLRPSKEINEFFTYCLGYASSRFGVRIHAVCALSNHFHLVLTDVHGNLPQFMEWVDGTMARGLNAYYRRRENFWVNRTYSRVELLDPEAVLEKMVYTLTNPVAAGLVSEGARWPGVRSETFRDGSQRILVKRPSFYFSEEGKLPESAELVIEHPESLGELGKDAWSAAFHEAVLEREAEIRAAFRAEGRSFLGPEGVLRLLPTDGPASSEPKRSLNPQVASRSKELRKWRLEWIQSFLVAYRHALQRFAAGVRDVVFPAGTYWLRVHLRCVCAEAECADLAPG